MLTLIQLGFVKLLSLSLNYSCLLALGVLFVHLGPPLSLISLNCLVVLLYMFMNQLI